MEKFNSDNEKINVASKERNCWFEFSSNADGSNMDNYSLTPSRQAATGNDLASEQMQH